MLNLLKFGDPPMQALLEPTQFPAASIPIATWLSLKERLPAEARLKIPTTESAIGVVFFLLIALLIEDASKSTPVASFAPKEDLFGKYLLRLATFNKKKVESQHVIFNFIDIPGSLTKKFASLAHVPGVYMWSFLSKGFFRYCFYIYLLCPTILNRISHKTQIGKGWRPSSHNHRYIIQRSRAWGILGCGRKNGKENL